MRPTLLVLIVLLAGCTTTAHPPIPARAEKEPKPEPAAADPGLVRLSFTDDTLTLLNGHSEPVQISQHCFGLGDEVAMCFDTEADEVPPGETVELEFVGAKAESELQSKPLFFVIHYYRASSKEEQIWDSRGKKPGGSEDEK